MKIGIISINMYAKGLNFACPLHTFAFQQFLAQQGIESKIIDYKPVYYGDFDLRHPAESYAKLIERKTKEGSSENLDELIEKRDGYRALWREREVRYDKFQAFIEAHYDKTDTCYDSDLLEVLDPGFDCYICATDVIWKKEPTKDFDRGFFLASRAMENKWKIAYAASRGVHHSETSEDERRFLHWIDDIDFIGVRENSLKEYLESSTDKNVELVVDPVMLHERSFYDDLAVKPEEEDYLFLYYVMEQAEDTLAQALSYARAHNLTIVEVTDRPLPQGRLADQDDVRVVYRYDIGIEEWLGYLKYAKVIFTNSFHASCFSILFHQDFYAGPRSGDKVAHVLDAFGLSERNFKRDTDIVSAQLPPIDYGQVDAILAEKRRTSAEFLLGAIRAAESGHRAKSDYEWWKREQRYPIRYLCDYKAEGGAFGTFSAHGEACVRLQSGSLEYRPHEPMVNDGLSRLSVNGFSRPGYRLAGWKIRFRIDNRYFWYLSDGSFKQCGTLDETHDAPIKVFGERDRIPYIPVDHIGMMVAEAVWEQTPPETFAIIYNSGAKSCSVVPELDVTRLKSGSLEFISSDLVQNTGGCPVERNPFSRNEFDFAGWRVRAKVRGEWYWMMEDGSLALREGWTSQTGHSRLILTEDDVIPLIPATEVEMLAMEATWTPAPGLAPRIRRRLQKHRAHKEARA